MGDTHMIPKKFLSQECTDHLNSVDEDIKWMTEGEVVMEALLEGSAMVGEEEMSVWVERALVFLENVMMVESDCSISTRSSEKTPKLASVSMSAVTIHWNTRGES